jgi:hypothetical protein
MPGQRARFIHIPRGISLNLTVQDVTARLTRATDTEEFFLYDVKLAPFKTSLAGIVSGLINKTSKPLLPSAPIRLTPINNNPDNPPPNDCVCNWVAASLVTMPPLNAVDACETPNALVISDFNPATNGPRLSYISPNGAILTFFTQTNRGFTVGSLRPGARNIYMSSTNVTDTGVFPVFVAIDTVNFTLNAIGGGDITGFTASGSLLTSLLTVRDLVVAGNEDSEVIYFIERATQTEGPDTAAYIRRFSVSTRIVNTLSIEDGTIGNPVEGDALANSSVNPTQIAVYTDTTGVDRLTFLQLRDTSIQEIWTEDSEGLLRKKGGGGSDAFTLGADARTVDLNFEIRSLCVDKCGDVTFFANVDGNGYRGYIIRQTAPNCMIELMDITEDTNQPTPPLTDPLNDISTARISPFQSDILTAEILLIPPSDAEFRVRRLISNCGMRCSVPTESTFTTSSGLVVDSDISPFKFSYDTTISATNATNTSFFEETQSVNESLSTTLDFTGPLMDMTVQTGMYIFSTFTLNTTQFFGVDNTGGQESVVSALSLTMNIAINSQIVGTIAFSGSTTSLINPLSDSVTIDLSPYANATTLDFELTLQGSVTFRNALDTGSGFNLASIATDLMFLAACPGNQICSLPVDGPLTTPEITRQLFTNTAINETYAKSLVLHALTLNLDTNGTFSQMQTDETTYTVRFNNPAVPNIELFFGLDIVENQFISDGATVIDGSVTSNLYAVASDGITETLLATFTASAQAADMDEVPFTNDFNVVFSVPFIETGILPAPELVNRETERFAIVVTPFLFDTNAVTLRLRTTSTVSYDVTSAIGGDIQLTTDRFGADFRCGANLP